MTELLLLLLCGLIGLTLYAIRDLVLQFEEFELKEEQLEYMMRAAMRKLGYFEKEQEKKKWEEQKVSEKDGI